MSKLWSFVVLCVLVTVALGHHCIHDQVQQGKPPPKVSGNVHYTNLDFEKSKRGDSDLSPRQVRGPIRMVINTDALTNDPDRLCTNVGEFKKLGDPQGGSAQNPTPECSTKCSPCNCWYRCTEADVLTDEKYNFLLNKVIPDIKNFFEKALELNRVSGNLTVNQDECACYGTAGVSIPSSYKTTGVEADMIIFLTARTTRYSGNTIAFACPCADDDATGRPIAGYINWGPNAINEDEIAYNEQLGVGIHELTHALGFTSGKYDQYNDGKKAFYQRENETTML